jgi:Flp pilus assembly protein TadG
MMPILFSWAAPLARLQRCLSRCLKDERGMSAVEFALLLPLLVTLYLGGVEVSQAITIDRKVTLVARTVADLSSQVSSISDSDMTNILAASTSVVAPYSTTNMKVTVSQITIDANGRATIAWSDSKNGTKRTVGSTVTLPTALAVKNSSLIWAEVSYAYTPTVGYVITGTMNLTDQIYMRPRVSDSVTRS